MGYIDEQMDKSMNEREFKEFNLNSTVVVKLTQAGVAALNSLRAMGINCQVIQNEDGSYEMFIKDLFSLYRFVGNDIWDVSKLIDGSMLIPSRYLKDVEDKKQHMR